MRGGDEVVDAFRAEWDEGGFLVGVEGWDGVVWDEWMDGWMRGLSCLMDWRGRPG